MQWDLVDWVAAFMLFSFALAGCIIANRSIKEKDYRVATYAAIGILFLLVWAELAVGIFD